MKSIVLLIAFACPLHAALLARFVTTQGDVIVELQYSKAPQTVANFITLTQATRTRLETATGAVVKKPFYIGEKFFRVVNDPGFKIIQTGSGNGTNAGGGPGYAFRDEFDPTLTHVPYVLSMANSGVNTNGSQIFLTGSSEIPSLNNVHTVFGLITDLASRSVIDAILAAGNDATTITDVTFSRTDAAAIAFNEFAQNLPICSGWGGKLAVTLGVEAKYLFNSPQAPGSILQGFRSANLSSWTKLGQVYQGSGASGSDAIILDAASLPTAFYNISLVTYPDALAPSSYAGKTLVAGLPGSQTMTFQFDATGQGGTATYSQDPSHPTSINSVTYAASSPYAATWIIETTAYNPLRFRAVLNSDSGNLINGRNTSDQWNGSQWNVLGTGSLSLTK